MWRSPPTRHARGSRTSTATSLIVGQACHGMVDHVCSLALVWAYLGLTAVYIFCSLCRCAPERCCPCALFRSSLVAQHLCLQRG